MGNHCTKLLISSLMNFVLEHGDDMNDYFMNEHGIDEENVVKVLDLASNGCAFALPMAYNTYGGSGDYEYNAFWSLYVVNDEHDGLQLKYYRFYNTGLTFDYDEAEPDHDSADSLSLAQLEYIYRHVIDVFKKS